MSPKNTARPILAAGLLVLALTIFWHDPENLRISLESAITLWWNHFVPVLLPSYVLAQAFWYLLPAERHLMLVALSFLTFPPLGAVVLYDLHAEGQISSDKLPLTLLYTNLYNPLLFPNHKLGWALDLSLLLAAIVIHPGWMMSAHSPQDFANRRPFRPRTWVLDGMNWTTIIGLGIALAMIFHESFSHAPLGWLLDPLAILWSDQKPLAMGTLFWLSLGGLLYWIPLLWLMARSREDKLIFLFYRLLQTLLALAFFPLAVMVIHSPL